MATRFDSANWISELGHAEGSFTALDRLIADEQAVLAHLDSAVAGQDYSAIVKFFRKRGISDAHAIHRRRMVVLAATLLEGAVGNFLRAMFEAKPDRLYEYVGSEPARGTVSIKLVVRSPSIDELLASLAETASTRVLHMKYTSMLDHLSALSKPYPNGLRAEIESLLQQRHRIVHEASSESVSSERVTSILASMRGLVQHLETAARSAGVPVYSVADHLLKLGQALQEK